MGLAGNIKAAARLEALFAIYEEAIKLDMADALSAEREMNAVATKAAPENAAAKRIETAPEKNAAISEAAPEIKEETTSDEMQSETPTAQDGGISRGAAGRAAAALKKRTLTRLQTYRETHGLGSFDEIVKCGKGLFSEEELRMMYSGQKMPLQKWGALARTLDVIEGVEQE